MMRFRAFVFIVLTLCFVCCLCAQAIVNKGAAEQAVNVAKQSAANALESAKYELKEAENVKRDIEWYESEAKKAVSEAETAATEPEEKDKGKTISIAHHLKSKLRYADALYPNAKSDAENAINSMKDLLLKARELNDEAEIEILPDTDSPDDYTKVNQNALSIQTQVEALKKQIEDARKLLRAGKSIIRAMPTPKKSDLMKKYEADGIVAASGFVDMLNDSDSAIKNIELKKDEVNTAVKAINELLKNNPKVSTHPIHGFLAVAQGDLETISQRVSEVHEAKQNILTRRQDAERSKKIIKRTTDENDAQKELRFIKYYATSAESALEKIKKALKSADKSVLSANNQKQRATEEILKKDDTENGKVNETTEKPKTIVKDKETIPTRQETKEKTNEKRGKLEEKTTINPLRKDAEVHTNNKTEESTDTNTVPSRKDATVKPTMINPEKPIIGSSQNSAHQASNRPEMEKKAQSKDKQTELINLDKLQKGKNNKTQLPFIGANVPASGASSDSSMIVSVQLLAALIVSAVLH